MKKLFIYLSFLGFSSIVLAISAGCGPIAATCAAVGMSLGILGYIAYKNPQSDNDDIISWIMAIISGLSFLALVAVAIFEIKTI